MELNRGEGGAGPVVTGLRGRAFLVGDRVFEGGVILTPDEALPFEGALTPDALAPALGLHPKPEFLLLGTGPTLVQPDADLRQALSDGGLGLEVMDSRAAARAWSLLRQEGRWISAALRGL